MKLYLNEPYPYGRLINMPSEELENGKVRRVLCCLRGIDPAPYGFDDAVGAEGEKARRDGEKEAGAVILRPHPPQRFRQTAGLIGIDGIGRIHDEPSDDQK